MYSYSGIRSIEHTLSTSAQTAEVPRQSEASLVNDVPRREACFTPMKPRRERREPVWLQDYVRTVVGYPTWPLNFVGTFACYSKKFSLAPLTLCGRGYCSVGPEPKFSWT